MNAVMDTYELEIRDNKCSDMIRTLLIAFATPREKK